MGLLQTHNLTFNKNKMNIKTMFTTVLCLLSTLIYAQKQHQFRLLDLETAMPITQATYVYGEQKGFSDENGIIYFKFKEENSMTLSHLSYGTWTITEKELLKAIQNQFYYRKSVAMNIYPVTIIGIKNPNDQPEDILTITYADRMEHDASQILNQLPAFSSIQKGGNYGFDPVFRGFKYDQLNVVVNGAQSATAACPNRMDPPTSQMAPNMMDRIEVLKGPYALRYGTGFGATINFIPEKLRFTSEPEVYGRVSGGYESNGEIPRTEAQIVLSNETYDINLFGSWSEGSDYTTGDGETVQSDFNRASLGLDLGFKIASNQQIRLSGLYNRARDVDFPALPMDLREDDTWGFTARHDIQISDKKLQSWNTTVYGSFVDHLMDNGLKSLDPRTVNSNTSAKTYNYGGRTEGVWQFENSVLYAGADLRIEGADGTRVREFIMGPNAGKTFYDNAWQDSQISKTGLFAEYQLKGNTLNYVISGRLELNNGKINDASDDFEELYSDPNVTQFNPSLSLGLLKDFGKDIHTGLWLGRAQRSGGLTERYINFFPVGQDPYEMLGNPELNPEVNNQMDITFQWTPNVRSAINVDVYVSYLQDYISSVIVPDIDPSLPTSPGVRQYMNIDNAFKTGFEVSWSQQLGFGLQHQLGIAYTYGQDLDRDEPLPEIAPFDIRYALFGSYLNDKLAPELVLRYVAKQDRISTEYGETASPDFFLVDLSIGYQITHKLSVNAGINNVLDANYYEHLSRSVRETEIAIYAPGRSVFGNFTYQF